jgi:hypothetical protein
MAMAFDDPATLFALKMALCLALFLLGAAWLRRAVERTRRIKGPPPAGASAAQALSHFFAGPAQTRPLDHERRLYRQTIRILAMELRRLDPDHAEAREALALLALDQDPPGDGPSLVVAPGAAPTSTRQDVRTQETQPALH